MTDVVAGPTLYESAIKYIRNGITPAVAIVKHESQTLTVADLRKPTAETGVSGLDLPSGDIIVDGVPAHDSTPVESMVKDVDGRWDMENETGSRVSYVDGNKKGGIINQLLNTPFIK